MVAKTEAGGLVQPCSQMNSPPLPTTFAHEGNDKDASETNSSPRPNIETALEPSGSQAGEKTTKKKNVLETSASIFDNSLIQAKYANERALDMKFRQGVSRVHLVCLSTDIFSEMTGNVQLCAL